MNKPVNCGCGGKPVVEKHQLYEEQIEDMFIVRCTKCDIQTSPEYKKEEAIEVWNRAMGADKNSIISVFSAEPMDTVTIQKINSVTPIKIEYYNEDNLYATGYICPNCHMNVAVKYKYCPECEMKLKWSEK